MVFYVLGVTTKRDIRHLRYFLGNDKVRCIVQHSIANLARSISQADFATIDQKPEAGSFAHVH